MIQLARTFSVTTLIMAAHKAQRFLWKHVFQSFPPQAAHRSLELRGTAPAEGSDTPPPSARNSIREQQTSLVLLKGTCRGERSSLKARLDQDGFSTKEMERFGGDKKCGVRGCHIQHCCPGISPVQDQPRSGSWQKPLCAQWLQPKCHWGSAAEPASCTGPSQSHLCQEPAACWLVRSNYSAPLPLALLCL